jgi:hypothetical protein
MVAPVHEHTTSGGASRSARLGVLGALGAVTGYVFLADPDKGGAYPLCPSQVVLGLDCPLCGGLRGTNALLHGRIAEALDHNLLLPLWLGFAATILGLWLLPLVGRPERVFRPPRWLVFAGIAVLAGFAVVRNLPFDGLDYLASEA